MLRRKFSNHPGIRHDRFDLLTLADDRRIAANSIDIAPAELGDAVDPESLKETTKRRALYQHNLPRQPALKHFERHPLQVPRIRLNGHSPFPIVIPREQCVGCGPATPRPPVVWVCHSCPGHRHFPLWDANRRSPAYNTNGRQTCNGTTARSRFRMGDRLYLDNAATSFPKPPQVFEALRAYAEEIGASAGRGAYTEAVETGRIVSECRRRLARLIGAEKPEEIVFTFNCSGALNQAIKGLLKPGDHVIATTMEHNSALRPLNALSQQGTIEASYVQADPATGIVAAADVIANITRKTRLVCLVHASNVTGTVQPIEEVGRELRRRNVLFLVDAAQTAGHRLVDVKSGTIDFLALPGHKGLMGPLGTGALYIREGLERHLAPLIQGGTGSVSELPEQPDFMPDKFESGSHNAIGLAGLNAALEWIEQKGIDALAEHDQALCDQFIAKAGEIPDLTIYGPKDAEKRMAVFSIRLNGMDPQELSTLMEGEFGILTRSGIHCAPLAHQTIGTHADGGTTRLSFGAFNTPQDVDRCITCLSELSAIASRA